MLFVILTYNIRYLAQTYLKYLRANLELQTIFYANPELTTIFGPNPELRKIFDT